VEHPFDLTHGAFNGIVQVFAFKAIRLDSEEGPRFGSHAEANGTEQLTSFAPLIVGDEVGFQMEFEVVHAFA
jgi:hypothetical protein